MNLVVKVLDALRPYLRLRLIDSSTDGADNMTGCTIGFKIKLAQKVKAIFYGVCSVAHQLSLLIKHAMNDKYDSGVFPFISTLTGIVGWLLRQNTTIQYMKSKYPYVVNVR